MRDFAQEKDIVVKYEELKDYLAQQREELEEKKRFVLAFKTEMPLSRQLEKYSEHMELLRKQSERLKHVKEKLEEQGSIFSSSSDTEILGHLIKSIRSCKV